MKENKRLLVTSVLLIAVFAVLLSGSLASLAMSPRSDTLLERENLDVSREVSQDESGSGRTMFISNVNDYGILSTYICKKYVLNDAETKQRVLDAIESLKLDEKTATPVEANPMLDKNTIQISFDVEPVNGSTEQTVFAYFFGEDAKVKVLYYSQRPEANSLVPQPMASEYQLKDTDGYDFSVFLNAYEKKIPNIDYHNDDTLIGTTLKDYFAPMMSESVDSDGKKTISVMTEQSFNDYWGNPCTCTEFIHRSLSVPQIEYIIEDSIRLYNEYDKIILPQYMTPLISSQSAAWSIPYFIDETVITTVHNPDEIKLEAYDLDGDGSISGIEMQKTATYYGRACMIVNDVYKIIRYRIEALSSTDCFIKPEELPEWMAGYAVYYAYVLGNDADGKREALTEYFNSIIPEKSSRDYDEKAASYCIFGSETITASVLESISTTQLFPTSSITSFKSSMKKLDLGEFSTYTTAIDTSKEFEAYIYDINRNGKIPVSLSESQKAALIEKIKGMTFSSSDMITNGIDDSYRYAVAFGNSAIIIPADFECDYLSVSHVDEYNAGGDNEYKFFADRELVSMIKAAFGEDWRDGDLHVHSYGEGFDYDEKHHWKRCECGETVAYEEHIITERAVIKPATENEDGYSACICAVCGFECEIEVIPAGHVCEYGSEWCSDDAKHYHKCACGNITDDAMHTFGAWKTDREPTADSSGLKSRSCGICGYIESMPVYSAEDESDKPEDAESVSDASADTNEDESRIPENGLPAGESVAAPAEAAIINDTQLGEEKPGTPTSPILYIVISVIAVATAVLLILVSRKKAR